MQDQDLFTDIEAALRASISADSFAEARVLVDRYTLEAAQKLGAMEPGSTGMVEFQNRVIRTLEWAELRTAAFRACASTESTRLRSVTVYDREERSPQVTISA